MPYLSKTFNHVISDSSSNSWTYEKNSNETITFQTYLKERKGYTDQFFSDLKELLQQTNLTITFDDENNMFNIFDIDFMLKCLTSNYDDSQWNGSSYYTNGVRPVIILPRMSNALDTNDGGNYNFSLEKFGWGIMCSNRNYGDFANYTPLNNNNHWINCNTSPNDDVKKQVNYTIKIYYNTNYIMCSYISFNNVEIPLFCLIQGTIITTKQKAVYLSTCINNYDSNNTQFHKVVIPSQNTDKTKCYDYFPSISNTFRLGPSYIFDETKYPLESILIRLSTNNNVNNDVFLNKLTAYGGFIEFDNVYDVTRNNLSNLPCQILTKTSYTIDGNNYYCPGFNAPYYNGDGSGYGRYIFKI